MRTKGSLGTKVRPPRRVVGTITVPGDKSISHRAVILGSLSEGRCRVRNFLSSCDCLSTVACMRGLGVDIIEKGETTLEIGGLGLGGLREPGDVLNVSNSGTTARLLAGLLAGQPFHSVLTGDDSLRRRPMLRVVAPLREMGARIFGRQNGRFAPLSIIGGDLKPISYSMPVASAQVKSAVLLAGLYAQGQTVVREPSPTRDHTERMLRLMGGEVEAIDGGLKISGGGELSPIDIAVPGDISSAAFFLVAALLCPDSKLIMTGVGVNPTRTGMIDVLQKMGANISITNHRTEGGEPVADLEAESSGLQGIEIEGKTIPRVIDELPIIAVAATQAKGRTVVRGAEELRVKETDRIRAIVQELSKMGSKIGEQPDGFTIEGPTPLRGARCQSRGDHRIAMALAVAGLVAEHETYIEGTECVEVSFPGFFQILEKVSQEDSP
ncbi:MAG: 3-phosphoshikimate 1-carboxyvinyltransferase [bacterium]